MVQYRQLLKRSKVSPKATSNYQQLRSELDELLAWFESDQLDLDQAVKKYERAMVLIAELEAYLKNAENQVTKLNQKFGQ